MKKKSQADMPFEFDVEKGEDWLGGRHGVGGERQELRKESFSNTGFRRDHKLGQFHNIGLN